MFFIDLKDAYFQVPIYLKSRLYLRFVVEGQVLQFWALFRRTGVHQGLLPDIGVGSSVRDLLPPVSG